jgi:hypothetical protein
MVSSIGTLRVDRITFNTYDYRLCEMQKNRANIKI